MRLIVIVPIFLLGSLASATTLAQQRDVPTISAADIIKIAPETKSCDSATFPAECAPASRAAPFTALSYTNYDITSFGAQAALLSLMLFESGSFKYNTNHFPGVAGQGTRNMQSPSYNLKYATWLATNVANSGITMADVTAAQTSGPAAVLGLVERDVWSFGSAAWFLRTQCEASVEAGLAEQTEQGWETYLTSCIGTTVTDDRTAIWKKAIALGGWSA